MRNCFRHSIALTGLTLAIAFGAGLTTTAGQEPKKPAPTIKEVPYTGIKSLEGKDTFAAWCAACHGQNAQGQGPAAPALAKSVPDLTRIASRNNGKFDALAVRAVIYGRERMPPAHGTVDMPIWGPIFESRDMNPGAGTVRMKNLIDYLQSIQQK